MISAVPPAVNNSLGEANFSADTLCFDHSVLQLDIDLQQVYRVFHGSPQQLSRGIPPLPPDVTKYGNAKYLAWLLCLSTKCTKREMHYTLALRVPTQNSVHLYAHIATIVEHIIIVIFNIDIHIDTQVGHIIIVLYKRQTHVQPPLLYQLFTMFIRTLFFTMLWGYKCTIKIEITRCKV